MPKQVKQRDQVDAQPWWMTSSQEITNSNKHQILLMSSVHPELKTLAAKNHLYFSPACCYFPVDCTISVYIMTTLHSCTLYNLFTYQRCLFYKFVFSAPSMMWSYRDVSLLVSLSLLLIFYALCTFYVFKCMVRM